jgi:hypothetical protein
MVHLYHVPCRHKGKAKHAPASGSLASAKIDRIACPSRIRCFIAEAAEFIYVPTDQVFAVAKATGATPYDIPGAESFSHQREQCSSDAFRDHYKLHEPTLDQLALIVRGADTGVALDCWRSLSVSRPVRKLRGRSRYAGAGHRGVRRVLRLVPFAAARDAQLDADGM